MQKPNYLDVPDQDWNMLAHDEQVALEPSSPIDYDGLEPLEDLDAKLATLAGPYSTFNGDAIRAHLDMLDEMLDGLAGGARPLTSQSEDGMKERIQGIREIVADWEAEMGGETPF